tara:strand:+ start:422 stop:613 length:192 start_codon:yes stop_codon:yes gene_type:complete
LAYQLAAASPHVTAAVIETTEFPDLVQKYRVTGVPKIVIDGEIEIMGTPGEGTFVEQIYKAFK